MKPVFNLESIRADFPILATSARGKPLVYLDNGATSQKPAAVIDAVDTYYRTSNANVHRGVHHLSELATIAYEDARRVVAEYINAGDSKEIIFTSGTTASINLVASSFGRKYFKAGDEILLSVLEHHSNIIPWQLIAEQTGAVIKVITLTSDGELDMESFHQLLSERTKMVAVGHVSNVLGVINPVHEIITAAHAVGAKVLLDGAQALPHLRVDMQSLDCDFYVFSSHKVFGPTGVGVLYGKQALLNSMPPYQGGGEMIATVSFERSTYAKLPHKFEAGTPNIAGVIGLAAALRYLQTLDFAGCQAHEADLLAYATAQLLLLPGVELFANVKNKVAVISFKLEGVHPHDIGTILDTAGVAVRVGHHCAMPLMQYLQVPATARASMAFYNSRADIDALMQGLHEVKRIFHE